MCKPELARSISFLGIVVFVSTLLRLGFLERSVQGKQVRTAYSNFAEIIFLYFARVPLLTASKPSPIVS